MLSMTSEIQTAAGLNGAVMMMSVLSGELLVKLEPSGIDIGRRQLNLPSVKELNLFVQFSPES